MRPDADTYFMQVAALISSRATCDRRKVGCVLVRSKTILSTGYNGSTPLATHCDDVGHLMIDGHCERTVHAEANAIAQAAKHGHALDKSTAYINVMPCLKCFKLLINAGVVGIMYADDYRQWDIDGEVKVLNSRGLNLWVKRYEEPFIPKDRPTDVR